MRQRPRTRSSSERRSPRARGARPAPRSQPQRWSFGMRLITWSTWAPQPDQVVRPQERHRAGEHMVILAVSCPGACRRGSVRWTQGVRTVQRLQRGQYSASGRRPTAKVLSTRSVHGVDAEGEHDEHQPHPRDALQACSDTRRHPGRTHRTCRPTCRPAHRRSCHRPRHRAPLPLSLSCADPPGSAARSRARAC